MPALSCIAQLGNPPLATDIIALERYRVQRVNYLYNYCNQPRAATYYVSESAGSDSNNGTSSSTPWQTLAKVQSFMTANPGGNYAILFKSGDVWRNWLVSSSYALISSLAPNITLDAYGTGAKPQFSQFSLQYNTGTNNGWTLVTGTTWSRAETNSIGCLRMITGAYPAASNIGTYQARVLVNLPLFLDGTLPPDECVLVPGTSLADVEANAGKWWYDATNKILYHNLGASATAPVQMEAMIAGGATGVVLQGDGSLMRNIRVDGYVNWGVNGTQNVGYCIEMQGQTCVIDNCEAYYGGSHVIGLNVPGASSGFGGAAVCLRCIAGVTASSTPAASSIYVAAPSFAGNTELYIDSCTATAGQNPAIASGPLVPTSNQNTSPFYNHFPAGGTPSIQFITNCKTSMRSPWPCNQLFTIGTAASAGGVLANCTSYCYNNSWTPEQDMSIVIPSPYGLTGVADLVTVGQEFRAYSNGNTVAQYTAGVFVNCRIILDEGGQYSFAWFYEPSYLVLINCEIRLRGQAPGTIFRMGTTGSVLCVNSVIIDETGTANTLTNTPAQVTMIGNYYSDTITGTSIDTTAIVGKALPMDARPSYGSPLYQKAQALPSGYGVLTGDKHFKPRITPDDIGPYTSNVMQTPLRIIT